MKKLKLFFALFAMLALGVGNAWGESLQATLDFTTNSWGLPTSKVVDEQSFTSGAYTIKVKGSSGNGYNFNSSNKYLLMGKNGATLTLPAFDFTTTKIVITGKSGASGSVKQNIYVGSTEVSTATTGAAGTNTYLINSSYQAAGNVYVLKVTSAHNTQITKIEIYGEAGGSTPPTPPTTYTIKWHTAVGTTTDVTLNEGATITKPATDPTMAGYAFMGWTEDCAVASDGTGFTAISNFGTATEDKDYYAVFAVATTTSGEGSSNYEKVTSNLTDWAGDYLIAYNNTTFADGRTGGTSGMGAQNKKVDLSSSLSNNTIPASVGDQYNVTLEAVSGGYVLKTKDGQYNYQSSNDNGLKVTTNISTATTYAIKVTFTSENDIKLALSGGANGAVFRYNTSGYFRFYKNGGQSAVYLYKKVAGGSTTTYSDYITTCASDIEFVELGDAFKWSATEAEVTINATDNVFPTLTNTHNVPVKYSSSDDAIASIVADGTVTLKEEGTVTITAKYEGGTSAGTGKEYKAKSVTYSLKVNRAIAQPTGTMYVKVTDAVTDGEYLIVYEAGNVAFDGSLATLDVAGNMIEAQINSNTIAGNTEIDAATFTIASMTDGHSIQSKSGKYIGRTASGNGMNTGSSAILNIISITNGAVKVAGSGSGASASLQYFSQSGSERFRYYTSSQKAIALYKKVDPNTVVEPVFTPVAGEYYGTQSVEITCATVGAEIYYTLDETEPTSASTKYTGAISIASTTTIKAVAIKGENSSAVVSATYTILAPLATMQAIFDKATDATQSVHIKFNDWVISGVVPGKDGKPSSNAYITDGSKGFIIYNKDGHGFNVGNKLSGTVVCDLTRYNGSAEVVGLTYSTEGLTVSTGGVVTPVVVNDVTTLGGVNTGSVVKITGVCTSENSKYYVAGVQLYNSLFAYTNPTGGKKYNVTGVYLQYNDIPEILPRSAADIEEIIDLSTATIAIADMTMEIGESKTIEVTITPDAAQSTVQYAITSGSEYVTLNGTTITAVAAGEATITATIAEVAGEYYGATKTFNVIVKPQNIAVLPFTFTGGKTDIENTLGMSQEGLGSDYSGTTNLRFDNTGDCVVIHFDSEPGQLSYEIKGNSFSGGTFSVQQSADGSTYTEVVTYTELGDAATNEHELAAESRYVKFIYTTKSSGNVGLGNITISKPDNRQEAGLAWNPETVTLTVGDAFTAPTLSNPHSVSGITYESSNEAVATVSAEGVIALVDDATGSATITATFAGDKDYKPATATCTIMVNEDCEGSDDFETATATDASSYNTRTTEAGWEATNAAKITIEGELGTYLAINGKTSAVGTITSPVLNGGIGSIKIRYANKFSESNGVSFRLDIKQNGEVVKTYTITKANDAVVKGTVYTELIENINVAGDFQMVFTNLSPSNDTGNKDRVSIGRLCWTGYEETPQEPKEETIELYDFAWEISDGSLIMSADWNETPVYVEIYHAGETLESGTYNAFLNLGGWADASIDKADASVELLVWANGAVAEMTGVFVGETTGTKYNLSLTGTMPSGGGEATEYNIEESNVQGVIDPDGNLLLQGETATIMLSAFDPTITEPTNYGATVMYNDYSAYAEGFVTAVTDGTNVEVYGEGLEGEDMTGSAIINAHFVGTILQDGAAVDVEVSDLVVTSDEDLQIAMLSGTGQHLTLGNLTFELYLSNYTGDNVEYQLTSESKVYYIYHSIPKPAAITGSLTKSYSSELNTDVYAGTVTTTIDEQEYEINLTMYYIEPEAVDMTVTNATITLEEGTLFIEGEWNSYPFIILDGLKEWSEDKQYQNINIEVGVWGENYYGMLMQDPTKEFAITVENNTLTFKGYFIKGDNQQLHNVTISGTMPQTVTEITLTEGENNLTNGATGDVTVNRSFIKDNLYTLSLPFALSATQVKAIFGANTVLYQFAKLAKEGDELVLYFSKPSAIAAGTPYLIIPSLDVNAFVVKGATITTNTNNISFTADKTTVTMEPVLSAAASAKTNGTTEYWLAADKYLYNNANTLLSLRALFDITTTSGMPPRCRVALGENVETSLEDLFTTDAPIKVIENGQLIIIRDGVKYNVQGQKL